MDILEQVQWGAMKTVKRLEHLTYKGRLRELGLFRMETKRLRGILLVSIAPQSTSVSPIQGCTEARLFVEVLSMKT